MPKEKRAYPKRDRVLFPFEAHLEIGVLADLVEQKRQKRVRFRLRDADDAARETYAEISIPPALRSTGC